MKDQAGEFNRYMKQIFGADHDVKRQLDPPTPSAQVRPKCPGVVEMHQHLM